MKIFLSFLFFLKQAAKYIFFLYLTINGVLIGTAFFIDLDLLLFK